jgi:hypothetical protein
MCKWNGGKPWKYFNSIYEAEWGLVVPWLALAPPAVWLLTLVRTSLRRSSPTRLPPAAALPQAFGLGRCHSS